VIKTRDSNLLGIEPGALTGGGLGGQSHRQSYFATDGQSVLAFSPSGIHDQILAVVKTVAVLFVLGRPPRGMIA
jgi:hypothetical protein